MQHTNQPEPAGHRDGERLRSLLEEQGIPVTEFAQRYIRKSKPVAYALLRKERFTYDELIVVCFLFCLPATFFHYPADYIPRHSIMPSAENSVAVFLSLTLHAEQEKGSRQDFIAHYFAQLIHYVGLGQRQLRVYQYLGKERHDYQDFVIKEYPAYYQSIEVRMRDWPALQYERFIALPIQKTPGAHSLEETLCIALAQMLPEMVRHVAYCLTVFPDRYTFFAIPTPARLHSFTLVDDRFAISEYDRIDRNNKVEHDLLFIDQAFEHVNNDHMKNLVQVYTNDLNKMAREKSYAPPRRVGLEKLMEVLLVQQAVFESERQEVEAELEQSRQAVRRLPETEHSIEHFKNLSALETTLGQLRERSDDWNEKVHQAKNCWLGTS